MADIDNSNNNPADIESKPAGSEEQPAEIEQTPLSALTEEINEALAAPISAPIPAPQMSAPISLDLAPLVDRRNVEVRRVTTIDTGPIDFVLRCTDGLFKGRFIYINRTSQGELFGSDKNAKDITMYIEKALLSPKHAQIRFDDQTFQYFLKDCNSDGGTWVKIRWNRSIEIMSDTTLRFGEELVQVEQGSLITTDEEISEWLKAFLCLRTAERLGTFFNDLNVRSIEQFREWSEVCMQGTEPPLPDGFAAAYSAEEEPSNVSVAAATACWKRLRQAWSEIDKMFPDGYPTHRLKLVKIVDDDRKMVAEWGWGGGTIFVCPEDQEPPNTKGLNPGEKACKDMPIGSMQIRGFERLDEIRIGYSFGRYFLHGCERDSDESIQSPGRAWLKLNENQAHWLQPQDVFRIGTLEFTVHRFNGAHYGEQGFRSTMEDEEATLQDLAVSNWRHVSYFAVYDGHGGRDCAEFLRKRLHMNFISQLNLRGGLDRSQNVFAKRVF